MKPLIETIIKKLLRGKVCRDFKVPFGWLTVAPGHVYISRDGSPKGKNLYLWRNRSISLIRTRPISA